MESEYLETILRCHYQERTIDKVLWIKSEPAVPSGQNFLSRVTRVKVGVVLGSGAKRTVSVVVKEALETVAGQWTINSGLFLFETKVSVAKHNIHVIDNQNELIIDAFNVVNYIAYLFRYLQTFYPK